MRRSVTMVIVIGFAACNTPSYRDCEITCMSGAGCPNGFRCDNQVCRDETATTACPTNMPDAQTDAQTCVWSYTPSNAAGCTLQSGMTDWNIAGSVSVDTSTTPPGFTPNIDAPTTMITTQGDGMAAVVISVRNLVMQPGGKLTVSGTRPVIILVNGDATISAIDVGAKGTRSGPASGFGCVAGWGASGMNVTIDGKGAGGGGGGSFGSDFGAMRLGASGGFGSNELVMAPGGAIVASTLEPLRGGCPGGNGGEDQFNAVLGAIGGGAGGGIQISARNTVTISGGGEINAGGGAGDRPTGGSEGAGGGGSGGAIFLEATNLRIDGRLCANGGGGGATGNTSTTAAARDGNCDGGGAGGLTLSATGFGGNGASVASEAIGGQPGAATTADEGGAGGGGGVGRIRLRGVKTGTGTISPTPAS